MAFWGAITQHTFIEEGWKLIGNGRETPVLFNSEQWGRWEKFFCIHPPICEDVYS